MTFSVFELLGFGGRPVWLYRFVSGTQVWRFTSTGQDYVLGGITWSKEAIKHSNIAQTTEMVKDNVKISFPRSNTFVQQWLGGVPEQVTTVEIYKIHRNDTDQQTSMEWSGRVLGLDPSNEPEITLLCEPATATKRRMGLTAKYMRYCRHPLYSQGLDECRVDKTLYAALLAATDLTGETLTVPGAIAFVDGWFTGGYVVAQDGSMRFVTAHVGSQLTLARPHPALSAEIANSGYGKNYGNDWGGYGINCYPGCDHSLATCIAKFNNGQNHGGFQWKVTKNPFSGSSIV